jgi:hypothetical protein
MQILCIHSLQMDDMVQYGILLVESQELACCFCNLRAPGPQIKTNQAAQLSGLDVYT